MSYGWLANSPLVPLGTAGSPAPASCAGLGNFRLRLLVGAVNEASRLACQPGRSSCPDSSRRLATYASWGRNEEWAHQDSNLEGAGYEPAALTIELWARR